MICKVSKVKGISGIRKIGSVFGNSPISPTVRTSMPNHIVIAVNTTIVTKGEGSTVVIRGSR